MASGKTSLNNLIDSKILSGGRRTTANNHREVEKEIVSSSLNIVDGGLVVQVLAGYASALTPTDDKHFAPKKYVDDLGLSVVHLTGAETIAGVKTFSSIPVLPASDPTTDNQAARKAYVDTTTAAAVSDTAYAASWDSVTTIAPSKNAVYDKIELLDAAKLNLSGGTMSGALNMGGFAITDIASLEIENDGTIINEAGNASLQLTTAGAAVFNTAGNFSVTATGNGSIIATSDIALVSGAEATLSGATSVVLDGGSSGTLTINSSEADITHNTLVQINAPDTEINGSLTVNGTVDLIVDEGEISLYDEGINLIHNASINLQIVNHSVFVSDGTDTFISVTGTVGISSDDVVGITGDTQVDIEGAAINLKGSVSFLDYTDDSKVLTHDVSGITTETTRTATWQDKDITVAGLEDKLSAFAATSSSELASVISDETGSGSLVFASAPTLTGSVVIDTSGTLTVASDTDATTILGRAKIFSASSDAAYFAHFDKDSAFNFALRQETNGDTAVNAVNGRTLSLRIGGGSKVNITSSAFTIAGSTTLFLPASTTSLASINFASGVDPTAPNDGDFWFDGSDLKLRVSGVTYTLTKA